MALYFEAMCAVLPVVVRPMIALALVLYEACTAAIAAASVESRCRLCSCKKKLQLTYHFQKFNYYASYLAMCVHPTWWCLLTARIRSSKKR